MKPYIKRLLQFLLPTVTLLLFIILIINYLVLSFSKEGYFNDVEKLPNIRVWLVFGASVKRNWDPSDILKDRLIVTYNAYNKWKIKKIIVSWDNSKPNYNEPAAMEKYLIKLWVKKEDIYLDFAGFDTYDSIYRAKHIFWVEKIILFTQDFHLKRAMYISKKLWFETYWVETNLQEYLAKNYNNRREVLARIKAFLDVDINGSNPKFLWEPVDMSKPQKK